MSNPDEWQRFLTVRADAKRLILDGAKSVSADIRRMAAERDCSRFVGWLLSRSYPISCGCCGHTSPYGIDTLLQTGHRKEALTLL